MSAGKRIKFEIVPSEGILPLRIGMTQEAVQELLGKPDSIWEEIMVDDLVDVQYSYPGLGLDLSFFGMNNHRLSWLEFGAGAPVYWKRRNVFEIPRDQLLAEFQDAYGVPDYNERRVDETDELIEESFHFTQANICFYFESGELSEVADTRNCGD